MQGFRDGVVNIGVDLQHFQILSLMRHRDDFVVKSGRDKRRVFDDARLYIRFLDATGDISYEHPSFFVGDFVAVSRFSL